jgi:hypothetical protein
MAKDSCNQKSVKHEIATMNNESEQVGKQTSTQIQGRQVLNLVQREASARGEDPGTTSTTVSASTSFLELNGFSLDSVNRNSKSEEIAG